MTGGRFDAVAVSYRDPDVREICEDLCFQCCYKDPRGGKRFRRYMRRTFG